MDRRRMRRMMLSSSQTRARLSSDDHVTVIGLVGLKTKRRQKSSNFGAFGL